jgi:hypothetical protein
MHIAPFAWETSDARVTLREVRASRKTVEQLRRVSALLAAGREREALIAARELAPPIMIVPPEDEPERSPRPQDSGALKLVRLLRRGDGALALRFARAWANELTRRRPSADARQLSVPLNVRRLSLACRFHRSPCQGPRRLPETAPRDHQIINQLGAKLPRRSGRV